MKYLDLANKKSIRRGGCFTFEANND